MRPSAAVSAVSEGELNARLMGDGQIMLKIKFIIEKRVITNNIAELEI
jgi:hypothetical protein